jgi:hypothetical protein
VVDHHRTVLLSDEQATIVRTLDEILLIAGHDAFVTSDDDDMLKKRADLQARTGIVVVNPAEAVQMAHGQAA